MNPSYSHLFADHASAVDGPRANSNSKEQQHGNSKRRRAPRAEASNSKRSIRILSTDKTNFRNMVQMLTGIPSSDVGNNIHYTHQQQQHMVPYVDGPPPDVPRSMPTIDTSSAYLLSNSAAVANIQQQQWPPLRQQTDLNSSCSALSALRNDPPNFSVDDRLGTPCTTTSPPPAAIASVSYNDFRALSDRSSSTTSTYISNYSPPFFDWPHGSTSAFAGTAAAGETDPTEFLSSSSISNLSLDAYDDPRRRRRLQIYRQAAELESLLMADDLSSPTCSLTPSYGSGWRFPDLVVHTPTPKTIASLH